MSVTADAIYWAKKMENNLITSSDLCSAYLVNSISNLTHLKVKILEDNDLYIEIGP